MRFLRRRIALLLLVACASAPLWAAAEAQKSPDMARVAIIRYEDKTGTKNFEYMPGSLQEAITKSMHTKFEFVEIDPVKVEQIAREIRLKNNGVVTPKEAAEICRRADIDILIYGNFTFNDGTKEIIIRTEISLGSSDKFRKLEPTENRVDSTIFQAADRVAADIVTEITKVALEQQKQKEEKQAKGKTQLQRTEKSKMWADQSWMASLSAGPLFALFRMPNPSGAGMINVQVSRRLAGGWHAGLLTSFASLANNAPNSPVMNRIDVGSAAATAGYFWDISARWRMTSQIGAGYYVGKYSTYSDCQYSGCSNSSYPSDSFPIRNPFMLARAGIHFLIFSFFSLGIEGDARMFYDSPKPVTAGGATIVLSAVF